MNEKDLLNAFAEVDDELLDVSEKNEKKPNRSWVKWAAMAACFVLIFSAILPFGKSWFKKIESHHDIEASHDISDVATGNVLPTFKSEKELETYLKKHSPKVNVFAVNTDKLSNSAEFYYDKDANVDEKGVDGSYAASGDALERVDSSSTYIQEHGVDEADSIKVIGNYLFAINDYSSIEVFALNNGASEKITSISLEDYNVCDMFVTENRLVVIAEDIHNIVFYYDVIEDGENDGVITKNADKETKDCTYIFTYDISDINNIKKLDEFYQSGNYISSRMINEICYLVTSYSIRKETTKPYYYCNGNECDVAHDCIAYMPESEGCSGYNVVSAFNVDDGTLSCSTKSVLSNGWNIYCSAKNIYIYKEEWVKNNGNEATSVIKISLADNLNVVAKTTFEGGIDSNYSFKEKDGKLFVAITKDMYNDKKMKNQLVVFDENLNKIAETDDFAVGESVRAVKYIGNYAYVITYETTDPLFVIDISDANAPKILGEVEISGFSTMLVDIGDNKLLGIGYCTSESEFDEDMEATDGLKLALFDVSNPLEPKVLDSREYKQYYSEAQNQPHAFVQNLSKGYYAMTYFTECDDEDWEHRISGALVVSVEGDKIVEKLNHAEKESLDVYSSRIVYVNDFYYTIDNELNIHSFEVK